MKLKQKARTWSKWFLPPQYTPNNDVQQSDIPTALLLMEYRYRHVQSELSVPQVLVVLCRTLCPFRAPHR
ncbi:hypothetical protein ANN_04200 [Periplaneta americana]|uniref:Uncharacterized protein n=1 Tax=Periplaneta americana TaxID=6978 RepID=A0ABQ8T942_PERAM|nr:hypothetical protein ANN_04200 [Periplaneta americana]